MWSSTSSAGRWRSSIAPTPPAPSADRPRTLASLPLTLLVATVLLQAIAAPSGAHDIPDERVDRALQVVLEPTILRLSYELCLSEWTLFQDLKRLAPDRSAGAPIDLLEGYAELVAPLNAKGLLVEVQGVELPLRVGRVEVEVEQHPRLTFHFEADVPSRGRLRIRDTNYLSSFGTGRLAFRVAPGIVQEGFDGAEDLEDVPEIPSWALSDEEQERTRQVEVDYRPTDRDKPIETIQTPSVPDSPSSNSASPTASSPSGDRLTRLFWDPAERTTPFLLLAAMLLGAAHAVQPGHGKTAIVGASLPGRHPIGRGLLLAGSAAVSHVTVAVLLAIVAVVLVPAAFDRIDAVLTRAIGLVLGIVGAWRIGRALDGSASSPEGPGLRVETTRDAILSGLAIGAIPCWDAVLLLALAWAAGQAAFGVLLVVSFSVGASATLLGVALASGAFRTAARRLASSSRMERSMGMVGGLLLAGIGAFLFLG
ncbi:hypothetical protein [Tautonia sociabilis]|uniref:Nickel/cobalt efflux system n=1 Tax=Tautonia sociabilis TaxID=2080755 RepID=A0A432MM52_9BACT|nr:hypothetical protein [Tautonia sociabilis]RUL88501.1 hypothetical protein TsocGM_07250 [Tautonia sociabilis]